ncbi:response regulator transcription factor [Bosea sp. Root381]|uniref:LuxR C-terminal-related transcriptional regulator n=1 Tax=Bosea sp. Root381 TaxID=1736524 RepID=UPI0009EA7779|nr:response regulator transcription factor [Bosea sp. Root381]
MSGVSTVIIETSTLFREGLAKLLQKTSFNIIATVSSAEELKSETYPEPEIVIVGTTNSDRSLESNLRILKARFPRVRCVVLSDQYTVEQVHLAFALSARGYLIKTISSSTLIKSLELVMLGESIIPSALLTRVVDEHDVGVEADEDDEDEVVEEVAPASRALSAREVQILQCLVRGQSNKMIARNLDIVEATVKAHIKAILRKIRVQNRVQAAIWAMKGLESIRQIPHTNGTLIEVGRARAAP